MKQFLICCIIGILISACGGKNDLWPSTEELNKIESSIIKDRSDKNEYFKSADSPLHDSLKFLFRELEYYTFTPEYVFKVKLNRYDNPRELEMITSKGKIKNYVEYGYFEFYLRGTQRLNVYRPKPALTGHPNYLFIPFKDKTNSIDTYAAGRYMELTLNDSAETYILDFNTAYNPWCAYSDNYNCPYPPVDNFLVIPVHAGERKFSLRNH